VSASQASQPGRTNVRQSLLGKGARLGFSLLDRTVPALAAGLADRAFCTPPTRRRSRRIEAFLATGCRQDLRGAGVRLATWRFGTGPVVVLAHGWGGVGGQLSSFVEPLVARGFSAVVFDAPGHGRSGGARSSVLEFAEALTAVAAAVGGAHGVIAHSLGGSATALALSRGLRLQRAAFVGAAADPEGYTQEFARQLGLSDATLLRMRARIEARLGLRWRDLAIPGFAPALTTPLLVAHDRDDAEVPWADGQAVAAAWPGARLLTTVGLGHRRILRDPAVVAAVVDFVASGPGAAPRDSATRLESELFDRDLRWQRRAVPVLLAARQAPQQG
jgi:pimeloyl-ACP methyl ester carboxylesterase